MRLALNIRADGSAQSKYTGLVLPFAFYKRLSWWKGLVIGFLLSAVIETLQFVLCRGLFEFDDMIHNGLGCMLGCVLAGFLFQKLLESRE